MHFITWLRSMADTIIKAFQAFYHKHTGHSFWKFMKDKSSIHFLERVTSIKAIYRFWLWVQWFQRSLRSRFSVSWVVTHFCSLLLKSSKILSGSSRYIYIYIYIYTHTPTHRIEYNIFLKRWIKNNFRTQP